MKTTSLYALAAAGVLVSGMAFATTPVKAADMGNGSDLEERVAELEATTVRKGNRKVSLELYGLVNRALLMWDDGKNSDTYIVDSTGGASRLGVRGDGKIAEGWKSGFNIEFDFTDSGSANVNQAIGNNISVLNADGHVSGFKPATGNPYGFYSSTTGGSNGNGETGPIGLRQGFWFIDSDKLGRVSIGQQSSATDDLTIINLSGGGAASDGRSLWNNNFFVKSAGTGNNAINIGSKATPNALRWGRIADGEDTDRGDFVRYDSPSLAGFIVSAAWGENDQWDVAVRYKQEFNSIRIAGGIGYYYQGSTDMSVNGNTWGGPAGFGVGSITTREEVKGSISAMHVPTGLYVSFAAGNRVNQDIVSTSVVSSGAKDGRHGVDAAFWYIQGGIDKRFFPVGSTTLYGEYGNYSDYGVVAADLHNANDLASANVDRWGVGAVQKFDSAAFEVYAGYQHWNANVSQFVASGTAKTGTATTATPAENFDAVIVGSRIKF